MPYCDLCGKETKVLYRVVIDGVVYSVCPECAKMGKVIGKVTNEKPKEKKMREYLSSVTYDELAEEMLLPNYGEVIRKAREARGISRQELAKALAIKESILAKIEKGELIPEDRIRRKLEKFLKVKLTYSGEERGDVSLDKEELELYIKAGKIAMEAKKYAEKILRPGMRAYDLAEEIEGYIKRRGGFPAFPVNLASNDEAAHYSPKIGDNRRILAGDVLKIDLGVHVDGCIADTAFTVEVGNSGRYSSLISSTKRALEAAISILHPGIPISEIGGTIEEAITSMGYVPIENLSGHQIERWNLHAGMSISNVRDGRGRILDGMVIAIEPFASDGRGKVRDTVPGGIYRVIRVKKMRDRSLEEFLSWILRNFGTLPFSERWCLEYGEGEEVRKMLNSLIRKGALMEYRILKERKGARVSQHEHTVVIFKGEKYVITRASGKWIVLR